LAKLGLVIAAAVALSGAVIMTACGKLKSENVPSAGEQSLTLDVVNATKGTDGRYSVRANSRDTIEVVATVKGLSSYVGFYVPSMWGTFRGGTLSATDGFYYYPADRSGKARATLVAGGTSAAGPTTSSSPTGRIEMVARSLDVEQIVPLSFDFATLMILPPAITISDTYHYDLYARGGLPPIEWAVSVPGLIGWTVHEDSLEIWPLADPNEFVVNTTVTVTARDAEGQVGTSTVTLQPQSTATACVASTITVAPTTPSSAVGAATISVVVVDNYKRAATSVDVLISGATSGTATLTRWGSPGVFQGNYVIAAPVLAKAYIFSYSGKNATCLPAVVTGTVTPAA
jgi:hypothetical protein